MDVLQLAVDELLFDPQNARKHSDANVTAVKRSLTEFGQQKPIVVTAENIVAAGNCTLVAAAELGWKTIDAVRTDLEGDAVAAYAIADNRTAELAEWNTDVLEEQLTSLSKEMKNDFQFDAKSLDQILNEQTKAEEQTEAGDSQYTKTIKAPLYEPKGKRPPVKNLVDRTKADQLIDDIDKADIPKNVKVFLRDAAERHVVFHFGDIAEFYCHANTAVQDLMERSGLVIIDFEKAIENGFVHLTDRLSAVADFEESKRA